MKLFLKRCLALSACLGTSVLWTSCAEDPTATAPTVRDDEDWGDDQRHPELGGALSNLTGARGTCEFASKTGAAALVLDGSAQTVVVGNRAVDGVLVINGDAKLCTDSLSHAPTTIATKNLKTLSISDT